MHVCVFAFVFVCLSVVCRCVYVLCTPMSVYLHVCLCVYMDTQRHKVKEKEGGGFIYSIIKPLMCRCVIPLLLWRETIDLDEMSTTILQTPLCL